MLNFTKKKKKYFDRTNQFIGRYLALLSIIYAKLLVIIIQLTKNTTKALTYMAPATWKLLVSISEYDFITNKALKKQKKKGNNQLIPTIEICCGNNTTEMRLNQQNIIVVLFVIKFMQNLLHKFACRTSDFTKDTWLLLSQSARHKIALPYQRPV